MGRRSAARPSWIGRPRTHGRNRGRGTGRWAWPGKVYRWSMHARLHALWSARPYTRPRMDETTVTKAVIPAAGLGTRFLPATKAVPQEMLPVIDVTALQL